MVPSERGLGRLSLRLAGVSMAARRQHGHSLSKQILCFRAVGNGRYGVKLTGTGKTLALKPANLSIVDTAGGFGTGFMSGGITGGRGEASEVDDDIIRPKQPGSQPGMFDEVQAEMKKTGGFLQQKQDEWCTPELLAKLEQKPELMKMMGHPQFMRAIGEFQKDPAVVRHN
jgi:hypothetical protein